MTATEKLCSLLDEQGIEYERERTEGIASYTHVTKWNTRDGKRCYYHEIEDGERPYYTNLYVEFNNQPTPEQAIAMTAEREATPTDELIRSMRQTISCEREAYEMLSRNYDAARDHIRYQKEQLDEMRAKLEDYKRGGRVEQNI